MTMNIDKLAYTPNSDPTEGQVAAARRAVCGRAADAAEATKLLAMLGLTPAWQDSADEPRPIKPKHAAAYVRVDTGDPCRECGRRLRQCGERLEDHPGTLGHYSRGLCASCYRAVAQVETREAV